jgi:hypothetical protein
VGISYGIYDPPNNRGTVCVGVSHDTPAFAAHSIATWWKREGSRCYGRTPKLLVLADSGGSNSCTSWAWKVELQSQVCNPFGLAVTIAHYPTGASKWNPIEHRLFSQISKNWEAEPLDSYEKALKSGIQVQEESVNLWKDLLTKLGSPEEFQAKLESMRADAFPQARERMEEFVETFNRMSNQTIDLIAKTLGVYQATSVTDAQRRVHDLIESSLTALRIDVHTAMNTNAKIIADWKELVDRFGPTAK